jgi:hypothetical protein
MSQWVEARRLARICRGKDKDKVKIEVGVVIALSQLS